MYLTVTVSFLFQMVLKIYFSNVRGLDSAYVNDNILYFGKSLSGYAITTESVHSLEDCVKECIVRPRCESVNFKHRFGLCELNRIGNESLLSEEIGSVYTGIDKWNKGMAGSCWNRTSCNINEKCIHGSSGRECIVSDCGDLPSINGVNFKFNGTAEIGLFTKVEYNCTNSSLTEDESEISCEENGEWSIYRVIIDCELDNPYSTTSINDSSLSTTSTDPVTTYTSSSSSESTSTQVTDICSDTDTDTYSWVCENATKELDIIFILDDTASVNTEEYQHQIDFFQRFTMRLSNITNCVHIACFQHSDISKEEFGFSSYNSTSKTCRELGNIARRSTVGDYEVQTVQDSLNQFNNHFNLLQEWRRIIFLVSDRNAEKWNTNQGRSVLDEAELLEVWVVTINVGNTKSPAQSNHFTIHTASMNEIDNILDDCINLIHNRFS